jgi:hypothetical protein
MNAPTPGGLRAADITQMDRQQLLTTITEADRVLSAYEVCRDRAEQTIAEAKEAEGNVVGVGGNFFKLNYFGQSKTTKAEIKRREKELRKLHPVVYAVMIVFTLALLVTLPIFLIYRFNPNSTSIAPLFPGMLPMLAAMIPAMIILKKWNRLKKEYSAMIDVVGTVQTEQQKRIDAALNACAQSLALNSIPPAYRYTYAMEKMAQLVQNRRAATWVECADKYEEMMHRMRVENSMEEAKELAAVSAFYTEQAAHNARAAAIFSGLNFFLK